MIAAVLMENGKPLEIITDIVSQPLLDGQVKVKIIYSGLCRSQLMEIDGFRGG
jgi:S-(hydroxymethyl)glutathione dehydrogenase/alcohol dehydrogenase